MKRASRLALVLLATLSACSTVSVQSPSPRPTPTASPSPSPTATPVPTPDLAALGQIYLAAVEPANQALCPLREVLSNPQATTQQIRDAVTAYADALRTFADALRATTWPPPIDEDARGLVVALAAEESALRAAASATSYADVMTQLNAASTVQAEGSAAANLLRGDLGIASVGEKAC